MERIKKEVQIVKPTWQKLGGGSLQLGNKMIKPGQTFSAFEDEIPSAFLNSIIKISEGTTQAVLTQVQNPSYTKAVREGLEEGTTEIYDIFDSNGKRLNEKALTESDADNLITALSK